MKSVLAAFLLGLLFTAGLALGGMTDPAKVLAFLDTRGAWDPSLAFVMGGAVGVTALAFPFVLRRRAPVFEPSFSLPKAAEIDARLIGGSALFGLGWGLSGLCPGPALVALVTLHPAALAFGAAMTVSAWISRVVEKAKDAAFLIEEVD
ncbi:MAG: YeeE/YedE family protein [Myxococcales bacterium]|nr:YeeE/YedE family protein [Myxococcales bacterium]